MVSAGAGPMGYDGVSGMDFIKIKETCLYISDLAAARKFYEGKLGLPVIDYQPGKHLFLRVGTSVLLCFNPEDSRQKTSPPPHYGGGRQHLALEVPETDYDRAKTDMAKRGIPIIEEVTWKSGARSFYFEDPEGNVLEIVPERGIWD
jgi:catechol 2,3-dioxygenase-like lactoylglutathione lyase family enzyme